MRRYRKRRGMPLASELSNAQILAWADHHHRWTQKWPQIHSGTIVNAVGETWKRIDKALRMGSHGLPGKSSLAQLLNERRGVRNPAAPPPLSAAQILAWADAYWHRSGKWPVSGSGPIEEAPSDRDR
jgi:hypothetical protein